MTGRGQVHRRAAGHLEKQGAKPHLAGCLGCAAAARPCAAHARSRAGVAGQQGPPNNTDTHLEQESQARHSVRARRLAACAHTFPRSAGPVQRSHCRGSCAAGRAGEAKDATAGGRAPGRAHTPARSYHAPRARRHWLQLLWRLRASKAGARTLGAAAPGGGGPAPGRRRVAGAPGGAVVVAAGRAVAGAPGAGAPAPAGRARPPGGAPGAPGAAAALPAGSAAVACDVADVAAVVALHVGPHATSTRWAPVAIRRPAAGDLHPPLVRAIELLHRVLGIALVGEVHEGEAGGLAGYPDLCDGAKPPELVVQIALLHPGIQITDIHLGGSHFRWTRTALAGKNGESAFGFEPVVWESAREGGR